MSSVLFIAATEKEAEPFRTRELPIVVSGVGRVNAAVATTLALGRGRFDAVVSVGVAGALPGQGLQVGDLVIADQVIYVEEGLLTPEGFQDLASMGFPPASFFEGNAVGCEPALLDSLGEIFPDARVGGIATVATCSGTDAGAEMVLERTGAVAEAMEGAAVAHAAGLLGVGGGEIRAISNQAGDRDRQGWDLDAAIACLDRVADTLAS
ncbi:MAG: futalosine hydrolase [Phycisphaerales bacterium]|nr:futalosine hydrolase [Phycisphaerales bacterium]